MSLGNTELQAVAGTLTTFDAVAEGIAALDAANAELERKRADFEREKREAEEAEQSARREAPAEPEACAKGSSTEHTIEITARFNEAEAMALAQFVKRVCFSDLRGCAVGDGEAYLMRDCMERLRVALSTSGFAPR